MNNSTKFAIVLAIVLILNIFGVGRKIGYWVLNEPEPLPCHPTGVTLIEYGVGVTNCGDTIVVKMPGDLIREFKENNP